MYHLCCQKKQEKEWLFTTKTNYPCCKLPVEDLSDVKFNSLQYDLSLKLNYRTIRRKSIIKF